MTDMARRITLGASASLLGRQTSCSPAVMPGGGLIGTIPKYRTPLQSIGLSRSMTTGGQEMDDTSTTTPSRTRSSRGQTGGVSGGLRLLPAGLSACRGMIGNSWLLLPTDGGEFSYATGGTATKR